MRRLLPILLLALLVPAGTANAKTYLPCNPGTDVVSIKVKPRSCTILPPMASFSEGASLVKLRWTHWGRNRAYFRGVSRGFHLPYRYYRVRGFAFRARPDTCGGRIRIFTRVWLKTPGYRGGTIKTQECVGYD